MSDTPVRGFTEALDAVGAPPYNAPVIEPPPPLSGRLAALAENHDPLYRIDDVGERRLARIKRVEAELRKRQNRVSELDGALRESLTWRITSSILALLRQTMEAEKSKLASEIARFETDLQQLRGE